MPPLLPFPSPEDGLNLHARLPDDPTAAGDICEAYIRPLITWLQQRCPGDDPDLRVTAVHTAILGYLKHPEKFIPERGELGAYLRMAAERDLSNERRKEQRHHRQRMAMKPVELDAVAGNSSGGQAEPLERMQTEETVHNLQQWLETVRADFSPEENAALDLMLAEVKSTAAYAEAMGIGNRPESEQASIVKRTKDRIKKRLQRGDCYDRPT